MTAVMFLAFILFLILSFPVAIAMGLSSCVPALIDSSFSADFVYIIRTMVVGIDSTPILAIPLFIISGTMMAQGGISGKLFDVFSYFLGNKTGGLLCATIATCLFYGAISGSGPATCAAVGAMAIPLLVSLGYDKAFCSAMVATAGGLGLIIPPSISFVNYALVTGTSVTSLFMAGILPGCLIGGCLMLYCYIYCRVHGEDKEKIRKNYEQLHRRTIFQVLRSAFWALLSPVIILGGIYSGIFSPTEAACISVVYAALVSVFIYRTISLKQLWTLMLESVHACAPLCALLALATAFSRILTMLNAPQVLASFLSGIISSRISFLILLNIVLLILGMFIDGAPAILILSPLLMPIAQQFGIDPVHLGIIMVCSLAVGLASPPFGLNLFVASSTNGAPIMEISRKVVPFILAFLVALILITFVPSISLCLV